MNYFEIEKNGATHDVEFQCYDLLTFKEIIAADKVTIHIYGDKKPIIWDKSQCELIGTTISSDDFLFLLDYIMYSNCDVERMVGVYNDCIWPYATMSDMEQTRRDIVDMYLSDLVLPDWVVVDYDETMEILIEDYTEGNNYLWQE